MENDFILPLEKDVFIEQLKDIVDKAEDMLSEDTEGEGHYDQRGTPNQTEGTDTLRREVRKELLIVNSCDSTVCLRVPLPWMHLAESTEDDFACNAANKGCQKYCSC